MAIRLHVKELQLHDEAARAHSHSTHMPFRSQPVLHLSDKLLERLRAELRGLRLGQAQGEAHVLHALLVLNLPRPMCAASLAIKALTACICSVEVASVCKCGLQVSGEELLGFAVDASQSRFVVLCDLPDWSSGGCGLDVPTGVDSRAAASRLMCNCMSLRFKCSSSKE
eukprot:CAMPEP_0202910574 /NCGR_PEP_ID=MMETSP1392-20130828/52366_1 /ASSEMBLY_ACC=CAM_ASM_000868 /TAXON_ID=225041 /ORGANISM="Chlamydomonas chlamydogama, Strain SAG 11-48b" /LENGTH=168 /DNA_ID=CAMNT_0049600719 /DNA_START=645 /DNA_END=1152 /DNA_ORIENTATION=+